MKNLSDVSRRARAALAAVSMGGAVVALAAAPAPAAGPLPVECDTGGTVHVSTDTTGATTWDLSLEGICSGNLSGINIATVTGQGTSAGAGLCSGSLVVQDLEIDVVVTERNVVTGNTVTTNQVWHFPVTAFPATTPFLIGGDATGAGDLASRIFLRCGESGSPTARAIFSFRS